MGPLHPRRGRLGGVHRRHPRAVRARNGRVGPRRALRLRPAHRVARAATGGRRGRGAAAPRMPPGTTFDEWGIGHWAGGAEDTYERMFPPLRTGQHLDEVRSRLPSPCSTSASSTAQVAAFHARGYPVVGYAGSIYEWSWWLRGMEQFMVDLLEHPELAAAHRREGERLHDPARPRVGRGGHRRAGLLRRRGLAVRDADLPGDLALLSSRPGSRSSTRCAARLPRRSSSFIAAETSAEIVADVAEIGLPRPAPRAARVHGRRGR